MLGLVQVLRCDLTFPIFESAQDTVDIRRTVGGHGRNT
jgi:hypothetical protein